MNRMKRLWSAWVAVWSHEEHPASMALVRIALGLCLLWDLSWVGALDLVVPFLAPEEIGGWPEITPRDFVPWIWQWFPMERWVAWLLFGLTWIAAFMVTIGLFTRPAALAFVLLYAQWADILDAADRGIDTMIRNVVMLLAFSAAHHTLSVDAWRRTGDWRGSGAVFPAWARHLLILQLLVMYFGAGVAKLGSTWTPMGGYSALWYILHDAAVARLDWSFLAPVYAFTQFGTATTIIWEYSAPLIVGVYWYRHTWERPGRLRAWCNRYKVHLWWLVVGLLFHVLIAITLNLGIFPFAMLAMYPAFFHPSELPGSVRRLAGVPALGPVRDELPHAAAS